MVEHTAAPHYCPNSKLAAFCSVLLLLLVLLGGGADNQCCRLLRSWDTGGGTAVNSAVAAAVCVLLLLISGVRECCLRMHLYVLTIIGTASIVVPTLP